MSFQSSLFILVLSFLSSVSPLLLYMRPLPLAIQSRLHKKLHLCPTHPIGITNNLLLNFFKSKHNIPEFKTPLSPVVSVQPAFDELLIPPTHPSRSVSDTFYVDTNSVLRPQSTCYQRSALQTIKETSGQASGRVWTCDVYRRDEVDRTHFPVFHQMDGVKLFDKAATTEVAALRDLKETLEEAVIWLHDHANLKRPEIMKWISDVTFPFTHPSAELEVDGVELLGCGLVREELLLDPSAERGWAFGVGLERLAMRLFGIDDIRIFWSEDERILGQFKAGVVTPYIPVNKRCFPAVQRDLSFWLNGNFETNEFYEVCRDATESVCNALESVVLIDDFVNVQTQRKSLCFRLTYRALDRTLTNEEVNEWHEKVASRVASQLGVLIR